MSALDYEMAMKHEMITILNCAISSESIQQKIDIASRVYNEQGIMGIINTGLRKRIEGLSNELEELQKLQKRLR